MNTSEPVDDALASWAAGHLPSEAAVAIALQTSIREQLIPRFVHWVTLDSRAAGLDLDEAMRAWRGGRLHLAPQGEVLLLIVANLLGAGEAVNLPELWELDAHDIAIVTAELRRR